MAKFYDILEALVKYWKIRLKFSWWYQQIWQYLEEKLNLKIQKLNLKTRKLKKPRKYLRKLSWIDAQKKALGEDREGEFKTLTFKIGGLGAEIFRIDPHL